jgi:hypothetical protein
MPNATAVIRPQGDCGRWQIVGGAASAGAAIARPVSQPAAVDSTSYIWAGSPDASADISFGAAPVLDSPSLGRLWFYANTGADTRLHVEANSSGVVLGEQWVDAGAGFDWHLLEFPQAAAAGGSLGARFIAIGGGDSNVRAAYLELVTTGSTQGGDPRIRVVGPTDKVRPTDPQLGGTEFTATAAGNEITAFQVVVTATAGDLTDFSVAVNKPLLGQRTNTSIPVQAVTVYRVGYVTTQHATFSDTAPGSVGRWPDPLIPASDPIENEARNAFPIHIPSGENRVAWIEIHIPAGCAADDYAGSVHVTAGGLDAAVFITVTVLNFDLPSTPRYASAFIAGMDQACQSLGYNIDTQGWDVLAKFIRLGLNNRVTVPSMLRLLRGGGDDERPNFERAILPLLDGSAATTRLSGSRMTSISTLSGGSGIELAAWRDEANAHGFADRAFVYDSDLCDEIAGTGKSWPICRDQRVATVLSTWQEVPVLLTATIDDTATWQNTNPPGPVTQIDNAGGRLRLTVVIDQLFGKSGTYAGDQRPNYNAFLGNARHSLWLYSSCDSWACGNSGPHDDGWAGGYAIDQPGGRTRAMGWLGYRFQASGELYYDSTAQMTTAWAPGGLWNFGGNGDGTLFYPGKPDQDIGDNTTLGGATAIPLESIRLKNILQGVQDFEWLIELSARGGDAQAIADQYFPTPYGITATDDTFRQARAAVSNVLRPLL